MKKLLIGLFAFTFCLWAAEFWQSKPSTEWGDKDLQKMMTNSPWARPFSVPMSGPAPPTIGRAGSSNAADDTGAPPPISSTSGGGRGRGGGGAAAPDAPGGGAASVNIVARWQSALPIKQAFVRQKYGAEAATSADAKQLLEREEPSYLIVLYGPLRPLMRGDLEELKRAITNVSSLSVKGKEPVKPAQIQIGSSQRNVEIALAFPRSTPFTLDDKEVEFSTKLGDVTMKFKFRLKDMVYNGKLEL
jgi:hypothetical protein